LENLQLDTTITKPTTRWWKLAAAVAVISTICPLGVEAAMLHVWTNSPAPAVPYNAWSNAAHTIQDAVDVATAGDTVLVTNGVYNTGGTAALGYGLTNRVCVAISVTIRSVNGPEVTIIEGRRDPAGPYFMPRLGPSAIRGVYMANGATLIGFSITNGCTDFSDAGEHDESGGGVFMCPDTGCMVSNSVLVGNHARSGGGSSHGVLRSCVLSANHALGGGGVSAGELDDCLIRDNTAESGGGAFDSDLTQCTISQNYRNTQYGGGTYSGVLRNCLVIRNGAGLLGGGASGGTLLNCTVTGNGSDWNGGGTSGSILTNCIVYGNHCPTGPTSNYVGGSASHCWIGVDPRFVDPASDDFHLRYDSPCIDSGTDLTGTISDDFDGTPRPLDGDFDGVAEFDIGAYEYLPNQDTDSDTMPDGWEHRFNLDPSDPSDASGMFDSDPHCNLEEFIADTDPTDGDDYLRVLAISNNSPVSIHFDSSSNRAYSLLRRSSLVTGQWALVNGQTNVLGTGAEDMLTDTNATTTTDLFYRLRVGMPE